MPASKRHPHMLKSLTLEQVTALDHEAINGNGLAYYETAMITHAVVYKNRISAHVGNYAENTQVRITFHEHDFAGSCTCQKSRKICRHIVALLYAWIHDGGEFLEVEKILCEVKKMGKTRLLEIIENILQQKPEFAGLFLSKRPPDWDEIDLEIE